MVRIEERPQIEQSLSIREAEPGDAEDVAKLAAALNAHEGKGSLAFSADDFWREGFGPKAAFSTLVAEENGALVGYALFYPGYDVETAARGVHLADLFVLASSRRRGVGGALLAAVARASRAAGGRWISWAVVKNNREGLEFYRAIGAEEDADTPFWTRLDVLEKRLARRG